MKNICIFRFLGNSEYYTKKELCNSYMSTSIVRVVKFEALGWAGNVIRRSETINVCISFARKPVWRRSLGWQRTLSDGNREIFCENEGRLNWLRNLFNGGRALLLTVLNLQVLLPDSQFAFKMDVCEDRNKMEPTHDRVEGGHRC
jgi:hypothetical protein